jgi:hypothetical protein
MCVCVSISLSSSLSQPISILQIPLPPADDLITHTYTHTHTHTHPYSWVDPSDRQRFIRMLITLSYGLGLQQAEEHIMVGIIFSLPPLLCPSSFVFFKLHTSLVSLPPTHTRTHIHIHTYTYTHIHTYTHTHIHTHTHSCCSVRASRAASLYEVNVP